MSVNKKIYEEGDTCPKCKKGKLWFQGDRSHEAPGKEPESGEVERQHTGLECDNDKCRHIVRNWKLTLRENIGSIANIAPRK